MGLETSGFNPIIFLITLIGYEKHLHWAGNRCIVYHLKRNITYIIHVVIAAESEHIAYIRTTIVLTIKWTIYGQWEVNRKRLRPTRLRLQRKMRYKAIEIRKQ